MKGFNSAKEAANGRINILLGMELRFDSDSDPNDYLVYGVEESFLRDNKDLLNMNISSFSALAQKRLNDISGSSVQIRNENNKCQIS